MTTINEKRGRPELSEKDRRSVVVQFRCTEIERKKLQKLASKNGMKLSDWLRSISLESVLSSKVSKMESEK